ncbi:MULTISPECIES: hypothetical protein [Eubacteriales]|uniref:Uncharacterized protein n=1 Tax=Flintibacter hominis TaxID=2763048 RepID=A0A8J6J9G5_9FIRM|nr:MULTISPECIES: hypothetical protein [Eubacteriales]MBC5722387.1 hypothetical protein [Flintibacter hominis]
MEHLILFGGLLAVLLLILVVGNLWFHLVEWALARIKELFLPQKRENWHTFSDHEEKK